MDPHESSGTQRERLMPRRCADAAQGVGRIDAHPVDHFLAQASRQPWLAPLPSAARHFHWTTYWVYTASAQDRTNSTCGRRIAATSACRKSRRRRKRSWPRRAFGHTR